MTASFPPQATPVNGKMLRRFAARTTLQPGDLDEIRAVFGEKVAFYYAFIQSYSIFLLVPSAAGVLSYLGLRSYSPLFSAVISLWSIVFVEYWRRQEIDLSLRWDVKGANTLKVNRPQYVWDEEHKDPITGEVERNFSTRKRLSRQALFLPFALLSGVALGTVLVITFVLEAWLKDVDAGSQQPWVGLDCSVSARRRGLVKLVSTDVSLVRSSATSLQSFYLSASPTLLPFLKTLAADCQSMRTTAQPMSTTLLRSRNLS